MYEEYHTSFFRIPVVIVDVAVVVVVVVVHLVHLVHHHSVYIQRVG